MQQQTSTRMGIRAGLLVVALLSGIAVCAADGPAPDTDPADPHAAYAPGANALTQPDAGTVLADTAWRLVQIVSMDDQVYAPDDRSAYTLAFNADGAMRIRADCNSGTGSWTSESAGQLRFGRIAATQARCPPRSLHNRYMAQFPWVRSYAMKDGHLFLATMADGSIIEFEPMSDE